LISLPPSPWPSPWAGISPTMSLARRRRRSWSASLSLPVACSLVMILGKQLCETADRECDAKSAAITPIVPMPSILAVVYYCTFSRETRENEKEKEKKRDLVFEGWNDVLSAAARPSCLFIAKQQFSYDVRWLEGKCCHHTLYWHGRIYACLYSLGILHFLCVSGRPTFTFRSIIIEY
jgi:hypothetical protein